MSKIYNNSIVSLFIFLIVLGVGFIAITPTKASAVTLTTEEYMRQKQALERQQSLNNLQRGNNTASGSQYGYNTNSGSGGNGNNTSGNNSANGYGQNGTNAAAVVYMTSPMYVKAGSTVVSVNVIGNNFVPSAIVRWAGSDRVTTYISTTQLVVKLLDTDLITNGKFPITVYTPAPGGGISNPVAFVVNDGTPIASTNFYSTDTTYAYNGNAYPIASVTAPTAPVVVAPATTTNQNKNLTANASTKSGFFPWGFLFWIFLAIAILLAVILWRQYYLKKKEDEEKNEGGHLPLKHA